MVDLSVIHHLPVAGVNETLGQWAEDFIGVFRKGGKTFVGLVVGIVPLLIVLLTAVHALIKLIGPERIDRVGEMAGRPGLQYYPLRYLVLPVLAEAHRMPVSGKLAVPRPRFGERAAAALAMPAWKVFAFAACAGLTMP